MQQRVIGVRITRKQGRDGRTHDAGGPVRRHVDKVDRLS